MKTLTAEEIEEQVVKATAYMLRRDRKQMLSQLDGKVVPTTEKYIGACGLLEAIHQGINSAGYQIDYPKNYLDEINIEPETYSYLEILDMTDEQLQRLGRLKGIEWAFMKFLYGFTWDFD